MRDHVKASSAGPTSGRGTTGDAGGSGAPSGRRARFAVALLVAALALAVLAPNSMASVFTRARTASFGPEGTVLGTFSTPGSLAFDQAADKLYALDEAFPDVLHAFDTPAITLPGGAFPKTLTATGFEPSIAVDNTAGATAGHTFYAAQGVLHGYDSSGAGLGGNFPVSLPSEGLYAGAAVDSAGNIYVCDYSVGARNIRKYDPAGNLLGTISTSTVGGPRRLAFDANDDLFFTTFPLGLTEEEAQEKVGVYKATAASGYSQASFTKVNLGQEFPGIGANAIAVDTTSHTLYLAEFNRVSAFDATTGALLYEFAGNVRPAVSSGSRSFDGIAIDEATGTVYLSDAATGQDKVHVFGPAQSYGDATAAPTAAKAITDTSAEIGGTISDNNVLPTSWRLELSSDGGSSWSTVESGQTASRGVTATSTGLSIGTLTVKAAGGTFTLAFQGKTTPPLAHNASAASVEAALEALSTIGAGNVDVKGGPGGSAPYDVTFTGALSGAAVSQIGGNPLNLVGAPEKVSAAATGLDPNTEYKFRLVTNKGPFPATAVTSFSLSFKTVASAPLISDLGAVQVADTSARLVGTIDPRNTDTAYVFQYGTTPGLGSSTAPFEIGSGTEPIAVSQVVGGLSKDTTYYFRLVATNLIGTTTSSSETLRTRSVPFAPASPGNCSNEAIRQAQSSTYLPACRAYEMVTPPDKNQGSVDQIIAGEYGVGFSADGEAAAVCTNAVFGEPAAQSTVCAPYLSRRTATGWQTSDPFPRYCPRDRNGFGYIQKIVLNPNFDRAVLLQPESSFCPFPLVDPGAPDQAANLYRQDLTTDPYDFDLLTTTPIEDNLTGGSIMGGSEDFSHVVFLDYRNQTDDSPAPGNFNKIYDWEREGHGACATPGGCINLVSKSPANVPFTTDSNLARVERVVIRPAASAISEDGSRIYFQNGSAGSRGLYMRENNAVTYDLSVPECAVPADCGTSVSEETFLWANPVGDVALFLSCDKLTDASAPAPSVLPCAGRAGDGDKLYRWDEDAAPGHHLTDLTVDHEPSDGIAPDAVGILGASDNGSVVYLVTATGQLVSGAPTGQDWKLFRLSWNDGSPTTDYLGPYFSHQLGRGDGVGYGRNTLTLREDPNADSRLDNVTPDGEYLTITTPLALDPAGDRDLDLDAYRWDEQGGWTCVSCQLPGTPSAGNVNGVNTECCENVVNSTMLVRGEHNHLISEDGQRIFFSARDALVPADVNGEASCPRVKVTNHNGASYACEDIYEWHDGTLSLLTSGQGTGGFTLIGASADGRDVAFVTRERLVGWDLDDGTDIYDVRVGGGFPEPPAQPAICEGEGCRGAPNVGLPGSGAGTAVFQGPGNPEARPTGQSCPKGKRKVRRKGKVRCVATSRKRQRDRAHSRAANNNRRAGR